jgi:FixJ family two-component response regulator
MDAVTNPWGLTPVEVLTMDAVIEHGSFKAAARAINISERTVETRTVSVRRRILGEQRAFGDRLLYILKYDRWRQATRQGAPA